MWFIISHLGHGFLDNGTLPQVREMRANKKNINNNYLNIKDTFFLQEKCIFISSKK